MSGLRYPRGNWTPGQWKASHFFKNPPGHAQWQIWVNTKQDPDGSYIGGTCGVNQSESERAANGQLMATAPELIEVVRRGLECGTFHGHLKQEAEAVYAKALAVEKVSA